MNSNGGFDTLVERRPWLARAMLVACSLSLLATSYDDDVDDTSSAPFTAYSTGPACTLTADAPRCAFHVRIRHELPDPGEPFFTYQPSVTTRGVLAISGVLGEAPFVLVRVTSEDQSGANELNALTEFSIDRSLTFYGGCDATTANTPCVSEFDISFSRSDSGDRGGTVHVNWDLRLAAQARSEVDAAAGGSLPWTVEYTPQ